MQHQIHHGKKFYQDKSTCYWISTTSPRVRAHVWVWNSHWGNIPTGYHIHHRNKDRSDNRIENLELIHGARHLSVHMSSPERKEFSKNNIEKVRHLTKEWHASEEGKEWHREHAKKCNFGKWEPSQYSCKQCATLYESTKKSGSRFCSNACKSKWRRANCIDDVEKECPICKNIYRTNKYSRSKTCGRKCGGLFKSKVD